MAERKDIEPTSSEPTQAKKEFKNELPAVESPSISPATPEPVIEPIAELAPAIDPIVAAAPASTPEFEAPATPAPATPRRFAFNARHKRNALLAASVAIAAALGAIVGAVASGGFAAPARTDVAGLEETKAMRQSIARLGKEITTLKTSVEAVNKSAYTQIAKISERFDRAASAEITGSISAPQTATPLPTPAPGAARSRGADPAAGAPAGGAGLVDPRRPRRVRLCGRPRRHLSGCARRAVAGSRRGGIGQAAGRPLGGADAQGNYRFHT
ncbi:MAG TPA: hypothetical protein VII24_15515 [Pseudolabrys sp.]